MQQLIRPRGGERGQSVVIVAVLLVAMMAMLALTFDGANAYFQRRLAQTAADAGALAGARIYCATHSADSAIATASDYAMNHNVAQQADVVVAGGIVTVTTTITAPTTFGNVLGIPNLTVRTIASAGCFMPSSGTGALPVAWNCKPPDIGQPSGSNDCAMQFGPSYTYIIMDDRTSTADCQYPPNSGQPSGAVDCDYAPSQPGDGINDITGGGDKSWLDLNGGGSSANELKCYVNPPSPTACPINLPAYAWREGQTGTTDTVFQAAEGRVGQDVIIPVYNYACATPGDLPWVAGTPCNLAFWDAAHDTYIAGNGTGRYFHIISFAIFHITCVHANGQPNCPALAAAITATRTWPNALKFTNNTKTIEGYFVRDYVPGGGGSWEIGDGGVDTGAFSVALIR